MNPLAAAALEDSWLGPMLRRTMPNLYGPPRSSNLPSFPTFPSVAPAEPTIPPSFFTATPSTPKLPLEILILIIDYATATVNQNLDRGRLAASLCLVSKPLLPYAQRMLYRTLYVDFHTFRDSYGDPGPNTESNCPLLRRTLAEAPRLVFLVRKLDIRYDAARSSLKRCAVDCRTVGDELGRLFSLPLSVRSLELDDREAYPGGPTSLLESIAEAIYSRAAWLDQLEELQMDCSGRKFARLLANLPGLRRLVVPMDLISRTGERFFLKNQAPLTAFEVGSNYFTILSQCLLNSTTSLRHLTISSSLLTDPHLKGSFSALTNLHTIHLKPSKEDGFANNDYHAVTTVLRTIPSLKTLRVASIGGVPSVLPNELKMLQLDDPYVYNRIDDLLALVRRGDHGLRTVEVRRSRGMEGARRELEEECRSRGVELRLV
ncbi:hypothetical protein BCR35DRAFT_127809 [Leucosporidium creatinivorum]|uniref:F-box domain-containing protein n=1 Tax=Leucosporidium creatinivorum TaxID=106004 RepID=A0A1Y2EUP9_9BASI|nr:hypothetical protein BCR35DRAFT_127809 [Leucosporidium creatinivorum]